MISLYSLTKTETTPEGGLDPAAEAVGVVKRTLARALTAVNRLYAFVESVSGVVGVSDESLGQLAQDYPIGAWKQLRQVLLRGDIKPSNPVANAPPDF